jgi:hypothetical protein
MDAKLINSNKIVERPFDPVKAIPEAEFLEFHMGVLAYSDFSVREHFSSLNFLLCFSHH